MTLGRLLENVEKDVLVIVFMTIYGTRFGAEHYPDGWLEEKNADLMSMEIEKIGVSNGKMVVYLKKEYSSTLKIYVGD